MKQKTFEEWLTENTSMIIKLIGVGSININYLRVSADEKTGENKEKYVIFDMNYDIPYKSVYINFYPITEELFKKEKFNELTNALTHELSHIITYPLYQLSKQRYTTQKLINDTNEEATESIAMILRRVIKMREIGYRSGSIINTDRVKKQKSQKNKKAK
jgi:hypothetical protein